MVGDSTGGTVKFSYTSIEGKNPTLQKQWVGCVRSFEFTLESICGPGEHRSRVCWSSVLMCLLLSTFSIDRYLYFMNKSSGRGLALPFLNSFIDCGSLVLAPYHISFPAVFWSFPQWNRLKDQFHLLNSSGDPDYCWPTQNTQQRGKMLERNDLGLNVLALDACSMSLHVTACVTLPSPSGLWPVESQLCGA